MQGADRQPGRERPAVGRAHREHRFARLERGQRVDVPQCKPVRIRRPLHQSRLPGAFQPYRDPAVGAGDQLHGAGGRTDLHDPTNDAVRHEHGAVGHDPRIGAGVDRHRRLRGRAHRADDAGRDRRPLDRLGEMVQGALSRQRRELLGKQLVRHRQVVVLGLEPGHTLPQGVGVRALHLLRNRAEQAAGRGLQRAADRRPDRSQQIGRPTAHVEQHQREGSDDQDGGDDTGIPAAAARALPHRRDGTGGFSRRDRCRHRVTAGAGS